LALTIGCDGLGLAVLVGLSLLVNVLRGSSGYGGGVPMVMGLVLISFAVQMLMFAVLSRQIEALRMGGLRRVLFRRLVFPAYKGYRLSLPRLVLSALPVSLTGVIVVALFRNRLDRTTLTLTVALIALVVGFVWSR
jgi:hypothetical protein